MRKKFYVVRGVGEYSGEVWIGHGESVLTLFDEVDLNPMTGEDEVIGWMPNETIETMNMCYSQFVE